MSDLRTQTKRSPGWVFLVASASIFCGCFDSTARSQSQATPPPAKQLPRRYPIGPAPQINEVELYKPFINDIGLEEIQAREASEKGESPNPYRITRLAHVVVAGITDSDEQLIRAIAYSTFEKQRVIRSSMGFKMHMTGKDFDERRAKEAQIDSIYAQGFRNLKSQLNELAFEQLDLYVLRRYASGAPNILVFPTKLQTKDAKDQPK